jgi:hypothetical protein
LADAGFTYELDSTSVDLLQGATGQVALTINNTGTIPGDDFASITLSHVSDDFIDRVSHQIEITYDEPLTLDLDITDEGVYTIDITSDEDQYLGEYTGTFTITAITEDGQTLTQTFELTINSENEFVSLDIEDYDDLEELEPGDDFTVEIDVQNELSGIDLENVEIKVWIMDIDDNDDLDAESSDFDIGSSDHESEKIDFTIPINVDEDWFDMKVRVRGEDEDGTDFEVIQYFERAVEVIKDEDERVDFDDFEISSTNLACGSTFSVNVDAINTGEDDLDEMYFRLKIEGTDVNLKSEDFDLDSGDYDDREVNVDFYVTLPNDLDKESYNLEILAYNEDNDLLDGHYKVLTVTPCIGDNTQDEDETEELAEEEDIQDAQGTIYLPTGDSIFSGLDNDAWKTGFWILGDVVLVIVAIYFLVLIFRKRR